VIDRNAEGIVERRRIVNVERDEVRDASGLEKLRDVACAHRVTQLRATVLAREGQVGKEGDRSRRADVAQSEKQEQQAHQTLSDGSIRAACERLENEGGLSAHGDERSELEFAFFERTLLERRQRRAGFSRDRTPERLTLGEAEEKRARVLVHGGVNMPPPGGHEAPWRVPKGSTPP
jgi:hypothetical protein